MAFSILTLKQVQPRGRAIFSNVTEVQTPDAHTAIVVLSKPAPYLLPALAGAESPIVPKHLYEGTDIVANKHNSSPDTGRASCRESVCQYGSISGAAVSLKKKSK